VVRCIVQGVDSRRQSSRRGTVDSERAVKETPGGGDQDHDPVTVDELRQILTGDLHGKASWEERKNRN